MEKCCLIIDDENQEDVFKDSIQGKLKKEGIKTEGIIIDTSVPEVLTADQKLDFTKLQEYIRNKISSYHIDLIAIDFELNDGKKGIDIIEPIIKPLCPRTPIVIYSGKFKKILGLIFDDYEKDKNREACLQRMQNLYQNMIRGYVERPNLPEEMVRLLKIPPTYHEIFLKELYLLANDVLPIPLNIIGGKSCKEIAFEIERKTELGDKYMRELIEYNIGFIKASKVSNN